MRVFVYCGVVFMMKFFFFLSKYCEIMCHLFLATGRVDTDGDDTHITTPHKYASIKPQIGGKRSKNGNHG